MELQAPDAFTCAITRDIMEDPVVAADGHSYERVAITHWLSRSRRSPMTNEPMGTELVPNIALRKAIGEWRTQAPLALDPVDLTVSDSVLGVGSFGTVLAGTLKTGGREQRVAVKTISAATRAEQRKKFAAELRAHIVAQQGADGVCRLLGTCEKSGVMYLVMRRYERSLADRLAASGPSVRLGDSEVRRIGHSLCITLEQLHGAGVIVSDIKPQNVLFDAYDRPVFADFGIAALVGRTTRIVPTCVRGSFNYMAPEALEPPFGVEADVWSMACLLVEMHTGQAPWGQMQMQQIVTAVLVRRRTPDVPGTMPAAETIRKCFAFAPRDRPTAGALAAALNGPANYTVNTSAVTPIPPRGPVARTDDDDSEGWSDCDDDEEAHEGPGAHLLRDNEALKAQLAVVTSKLSALSARPKTDLRIVVKSVNPRNQTPIQADITLGFPLALDICQRGYYTESAGATSIAAAFRAFRHDPSVPLRLELLTFQSYISGPPFYKLRHDGSPHELFALIVQADWCSNPSPVDSHLLHTIGPQTNMYCSCMSANCSCKRRPIIPNRPIGMRFGDVFVYSDRRKSGTSYPCGPMEFGKLGPMTPKGTSFGICVNGSLESQGVYCLDGLIVGNLKDALSTVVDIIGPGTFPRYYQQEIGRAF